MYEAYFGLQGKSVHAVAGSAVSLPEPAAPGGAELPDLRDRREERVHGRHRRDRHRQDDALPRPPGRSGRDDGERADFQSRPLRYRAFEDDQPGIRDPDGGTGDEEAVSRRPQRLSHAEFRRREERRPADRRGAEPVAQRPGTDPDAFESRDGPGEADPDHPPGPAGAPATPRAAVAPPAQRADHGPLRPEAPGPGGCPALYRAPAGDGGGGDKRGSLPRGAMR